MNPRRRCRPLSRRSYGLPETKYEQIRKRLPPRSRIALDIMVETGLRVSDVLMIRSKELRSSMHIKEKKNGYEHDIRLSERTLRAARRYARRHGCEYLIPWSRTTIWRDIRKACDNAGLPRVSPHGCRKLYARRLYAQGYGIADVQRIMGHKSPNATMFYLFDVE